MQSSKTQAQRAICKQILVMSWLMIWKIPYQIFSAHLCNLQIDCTVAIVGRCSVRAADSDNTILTICLRTPACRKATFTSSVAGGQAFGAKAEHKVARQISTGLKWVSRGINLAKSMSRNIRLTAKPNGFALPSWGTAEAWKKNGNLSLMSGYIWTEWYDTPNFTSVYVWVNIMHMVITWRRLSMRTIVFSDERKDCFWSGAWLEMNRSVATAIATKESSMTSRSPRNSIGNILYLENYRRYHHHRREW